jgi:hypothetical protein
MSKEFETRITQLTDMGMSPSKEYNSYIYEDVNVGFVEISTMDEKEWDKLIKEIAPVIKNRIAKKTKSESKIFKNLFKNLSFFRKAGTGSTIILPNKLNNDGFIFPDGMGDKNKISTNLADIDFINFTHHEISESLLSCMNIMFKNTDYENGDATWIYENAKKYMQLLQKVLVLLRDMDVLIHTTFINSYAFRKIPYNDFKKYAKIKHGIHTTWTFLDYRTGISLIEMVEQLLKDDEFVNKIYSNENYKKISNLNDAFLTPLKIFFLPYTRTNGGVDRFNDSVANMWSDFFIKELDKTLKK